MLTAVGIQGEVEMIIPILGIGPRESILIRKITGLSPADINLFVGDYSRDGGFYQGRRVGKRNPVITLDLNPNPALGETVSGLRELLYRVFLNPMIDKDYVQLNLYDDLGRILTTRMYAEKFEGELFDVDTTLQISTIAPDPYLYESTPIVLDTPGAWTNFVFPYTGTAETGLKMTIDITASCTNLTVNLNDRIFQIAGYSFIPGDVVSINSVRGQSSLTVKHTSDVVESLLGRLTSASEWPELHSRFNTGPVDSENQSISVYESLPSDPVVATIRDITFTQAYWGI